MSPVVEIDNKDSGGDVALRSKRVLIERLGRLMAAKQFSARSLSRAAGLADTYVNDVLIRKNLNPSYTSVQSIAKVLGTTLAYLAGETDDPDQGNFPRSATVMPVLGAAETGAWRKLSAVSMQQQMVQRSLSKRYPSVKHFVILVGDNTMAAAPEGPIVKGMEVLCVDMLDAGLLVESGKLYIVCRSLDGGATHETLLRRAMVYENRTELVAEPSGDQHEAPNFSINGRLSTDRDSAIFALGLVYGIFRGIE